MNTDKDSITVEGVPLQEYLGIVEKEEKKKEAEVHAKEVACKLASTVPHYHGRAFKRPRHYNGPCHNLDPVQIKELYPNQEVCMATLNEKILELIFKIRNSKDALTVKDIHKHVGGTPASVMAAINVMKLKEIGDIHVIEEKPYRYMLDPQSSISIDELKERARENSHFTRKNQPSAIKHSLAQPNGYVQRLEGFIIKAYLDLDEGKPVSKTDLRQLFREVMRSRV